MKKITLISILLILCIPLAFASDEIPFPSSYLRLNRGSIEDGSSSSSLFFLPIEKGGTLKTDIRQTYYYPGTNSFPDFVGEQCRVGEAIVPFRCHTQWDDCMNLFSQDYIKSSETDLFPLHPFKNTDWYKSGLNYHIYNGYYCKYRDLNIQLSNGRFIELNIPSEIQGGNLLKIRGKYQVTVPGPFVLEGFIDVGSKQPLAVSVSSSRSSCDNSFYWAGSQITGVAGTIYNFEFTVRTPTEPGKYFVTVHSWTDCWKDGGMPLDIHTKQITLTKPKCNFAAVISDLGRTLTSWTLSSSKSTSIINSYNCVTSELRDYCGTVDSDGDGIPDGCDYCPQTYGIPQAANGCHPCFGLDAYGVEGQNCYKQYHKEFGIPDRLVPIVNPFVEKKVFCEGNSVVTQNIRRFGDFTSSKDNCIAGEQCVQKDNYAVCEIPEKPIEKINEEYRCSGNNVEYVQYFSDGTRKTSIQEVCLDYCNKGACMISESCEGGRECGSGFPGINPENQQCSNDLDCDGATFCKNGFCSTTHELCFSNSDCGSGKECLGGVCISSMPECKNSNECSGINSQCVDGYCINLKISDDEDYESCTKDVFITCSTGGTATTHVCFKGELIPTDKNCVDSESNKSKISMPALNNTNKTSVSVIIAFLAIGVGAAIYFSKNKRRKKK